ncbi:glycosyltransferase [bacterium]|nr:glycosyltransferase [candidate division CSSED10-310 bacterium]
MADNGPAGSLRILFVSPVPVYPGVSDAGSLRKLAYLEHFGRRHRIDCIALARGTQAGVFRIREGVSPGDPYLSDWWPAAAGLVTDGVVENYLVVTLGMTSAVARVTNALFSSLPMPIATLAREHVGKVVEEFLHSHGYDVVFVEGLHLALHVDRWRKAAPRAVFALFDDDVLTVQWRRRAAMCGPPLSWGAAVQLRRAGRFERRIVSSFDHVFVITGEQKAALLELQPGLRVSVSDHIMEHDSAAFEPPPRSDAPRVVFLGSGGHAPNRDAVKLLVSRIFPLIQQRVPECGCVIVGPGYPVGLRTTSGKGIEWAGRVENLQGIFHDRSVLVAPLRLGGGLRGKIVSALRHGCPVVTTPIGAEGFAAPAGCGMVVAREPREMADEAIRLLSDPQLRLRLGAAGVRAVRRRFSKALVAGGLERRLLELTSRQSIRDKRSVS